MTTRRAFLLRIVAGLSSALAMLWARPASAKKVAITLDKVPKLNQVGGFTNLKLKDKELLLIRETETSIRVTDGLCTHQQCPIGYSAKSGKIECDCHKSIFSLDGKVLGGPAPKPLKVYSAKLDKDRIVIELD